MGDGFTNSRNSAPTSPHFSSTLTLHPCGIVGTKIVGKFEEHRGFKSAKYAKSGPTIPNFFLHAYSPPSRTFGTEIVEYFESIVDPNLQIPQNFSPRSTHFSPRFTVHPRGHLGPKSWRRIHGIRQKASCPSKYGTTRRCRS